MFSRLLRWFKPSPTLEHDYFGELFFYDYPKTGAKFWQGELDLGPGREPLSVTIEADESGPRPSQVDFVKAVVKNPAIVAEKCASVFHEIFEAWSEENGGEYLESQFRLCGISVPPNGTFEERWDVSYDLLFDPAEHMLTIYFRDGHIHGCSIDG